MKIFFTDLDNTLIFSHRRELTEDKIAVEWLKCREQSYMTRNSYKYLTSLSDIEIIPVTTRTVEQFMRLEGLIKKLHCRYALVCNGGLLFKDGKPDSQWLDESRKLAADELPELEKCRQLLTEKCEGNAVKTGENLMYYAVSDSSAELYEFMLTQINTDKIDIFYDSRKVFCIPKSLRKGCAVERMKKRFSNCFSISAGDSEADISMLEAVDLCIPYPDITDKVNGNIANVNTTLLFPDAICEVLKKL